MMTYFDSTERKLPFLTNNLNLTNPNSWNIASQAYNDSTILIAPYPKAKLNIGQQDGMNVWIAEGTGGKGIAMFDAPYSTYTGISVNNFASDGLNSRVYPNPCNQSIIIAFELKRPEKVTINLYNLVGQNMGVITDQLYLLGKHQVNIDVSKFSSGCYLYNLTTRDFSNSGKINVVR